MTYKPTENAEERKRVVEYLRRIASAYSTASHTPGNIATMAAHAHAADVLRDVARKIESGEHLQTTSRW